MLRLLLTTKKGNTLCYFYDIFCLYTFIFFGSDTLRHFTHKTIKHLVSAVLRRRARAPTLYLLATDRVFIAKVANYEYLLAMEQAFEEYLKQFPV